MRPNDLLRISTTNLDHLTETYNIGFYLEYLTKWPELCQVIEGVDGEIEGYSMLFPTVQILPRKRTMLKQHFSVSPRQTRVLALLPTYHTLQTIHHRRQISQLPPLARPHHCTHSCARRPTSRARNSSIFRARALL